MKCVSCGYDNPEGAKFCKGCGAAMAGRETGGAPSFDMPAHAHVKADAPGLSQSGAPGGWTCPACGNQNREGARFCVKCGTPPSAGAGPAAGAAPQPAAGQYAPPPYGAPPSGAQPMPGQYGAQPAGAVTPGQYAPGYQTPPPYGGPPPEPKAPAKPKSKAPLIIGIVAGVLVVAAAVLLFVFKDSLFGGGSASGSGGGNLLNLTGETGSTQTALHDGRIYYTDPDYMYYIFSMKSGGADVKRVSEEAYGDGGIAVSGDKLYAGGYTGLYEIDLKSGTETRIASGSITQIYLDGSRLYYVERGSYSLGRGALKSIDVTKPDVQPVEYVEDGVLSVSMYKGELYYERDGSVYKCSPDGENATLVLEGEEGVASYRHVSIVGDDMYYHDSVTKQVFAASADGRGASRAITPEGYEVTSMFATEDALYYSLYEDGFISTIWRYDFAGGKSSKLFTDSGFCHNLQMIGDWLYFNQSDCFHGLSIERGKPSELLKVVDRAAQVTDAPDPGGDQPDQEITTTQATEPEESTEPEETTTEPEESTEPDTTVSGALGGGVVASVDGLEGLLFSGAQAISRYEGPSVSMVSAAECAQYADYAMMRSGLSARYSDGFVPHNDMLRFVAEAYGEEAVRELDMNPERMPDSTFTGEGYYLSELDTIIEIHVTQVQDYGDVVHVFYAFTTHFFDDPYFNGFLHAVLYHNSDAQFMPYVLDYVEVTDSVFGDASASSQLQNSANFDYSPENAYDYDIGTAWVEGSEGDGEGEWLEVYVGRDIATVSGIMIVGGYASSEEIYGYNNRLKEITLDFSDGTSIDVTLDDRLFYNARQVIFLPKPVETVYVRMTIRSVYSGSKYRDTCVAEFMPF